MPGKYYLKEQTADPGTGDPSSGNGVLYFKADGKIYFKNYNGDIFDLTGGGIETRTNYWPDYSGDTPKIYFSDLDKRLWIARKYLTHPLCLEDAFRKKYDWSKSISFFLFDATASGTTVYNLANGSGIGNGTASPSLEVVYTGPEPYAQSFYLDGSKRVDLGSLSSSYTFSSGHTIIAHFSSVGSQTNDIEVVLRFSTSSGGHYFALYRDKISGPYPQWVFDCNGSGIGNRFLVENTDRLTVYVRQEAGTPGSSVDTYLGVMRGGEAYTMSGSVTLPSNDNYTLNCIGASNMGGGSYSDYFTDSYLLAVIHVREYLSDDEVQRIHRILTRWASDW